MKIKYNNIVEKHIEKMVLGAAGLLGLIVLWFFVLGGLTAEIKDGPTQKFVSVAQVEQIVRDKADILNQKLRQNQGVTRPGDDAQSSELPKLIATRLSQSLTDVAKYNQSLGLPGIQSSMVDIPQLAEQTYQVALPPAPLAISFVSRYSVLQDRADLIENAGGGGVRGAGRGVRGVRGVRGDRSQVRIADRFARLVSEQSPRDFKYVSVLASFDMNQWSQAIDDVPESSRLPRNWINGRQWVTDVILERQTRDPITGQWPQDDVYDVIAPLPGSVSYRHGPDQSYQIDPDEAEYLVDQIADDQLEILQPSFAPVTEVRPWLPPDEQANLTSAQQRELFEMNKRISDLRKLIISRENYLQSLAERADRMSKRAQNNPGAASGGRTSRLEKRSAKPEGSKTKKASKPKQPRLGSREKVQMEITQHVQELAELQERKSALLGRDVDRSFDRFARRRGQSAPMLPGAGGLPDLMELQGQAGRGRGNRGVLGVRGGGTHTPGGGGRVQRTSPRMTKRPAKGPLGTGSTGAENQQKDDKLALWAHDMTVESEKTYRYRLRIRVLNPLFGRLLARSQEAMSYQLDLQSPPTAWTQAVTIEPKKHFFVVSADGGRRANVEIYRIVNGLRRGQTFRVSAGDPLGSRVLVLDGSQNLPVDLSLNAFVVDVVSQDAMGSGLGSVMIYYDISSGQLVERMTWVDRDDPIRIKLKNEAMQVLETNLEVRR